MMNRRQFIASVAVLSAAGLATGLYTWQVELPFLEPPQPPVRNKRYTYGEIDLHDGRRLYINRALGNLWPVRFNMRPKVTIFALQRA